MADLLDLLTLPECKDVLEISGTEHDDELSALVTAVSRRIDTMCGPVVQRTVSDETHDGGRTFVLLDELHVSSASSVVEYQTDSATTLTAEVNGAKTSNDFLLDDVGAGLTFLRRRSAGGDACFPVGRRNVVVSYTAGRYADTASVDELFKRAASFMVTHLYKSTAPAWQTDRDLFDGPAGGGLAIPTFGVPRLVTEMLADEMRPPAVGL